MSEYKQQIKKYLFPPIINENISYLNELEDNITLGSSTLIRTIVSTFSICLGFNFNSLFAVYLGMFMSPLILYILKFSLGLYTNSIFKTLQNLNQIMIHTLVIVFVSALYFYISPVYTPPNLVISYSQISIPSICLSIFIPYVVFAFNKSDYLLILGISSIITLLSPTIVCFGYGITTLDFILIKNSFIHYLVSIFLVFIGAFIVFLLNEIEVINHKKKLVSIIFKIIILLKFIEGFYLTYTTTTNLIQEQNIEAYLHQAISSKTFIINSYEKDPIKNEINVYYSGIKSPNTQDESLKKKYKVKQFTFNYQSI